MPALGAAGFRAVAYDLRGYGGSGKPRGLGAYRLDRLAGDLRAILDDLSDDPIPVVAHDWGGVSAWWGALLFPERIERFAALNTPHPKVFRRALARDPEQRRKSRYMAYFQLPWLPERRLARDDFRALRKMLRRLSRDGSFTDADLDRFAAGWAQPRTLTSMLAWYRAALRRRAPAPPSWRLPLPVRIVWGEKDPALGAALIDPSAAQCDRVDVFRLKNAGHWVHADEPERVNALLLDFLGDLPVRSGAAAPLVPNGGREET